jgi:hypothetical protein
MITQNGNNYYGLSTDTPKPTGAVMNGRKFIEMDTGKVYYFDAEGGTWIEWTGGGDGE